MRKPPQLLIWIFVIIGCSAESSRILPIDEVLQTEQYIFVAQNKKELYFESHVPDGKCPKFMTQIATNDGDLDKYRGVHLLRHPSQTLPTRLMIVSQESFVVIVHIYRINGTELFEDPLKWHTLNISDPIARYNLLIEERALVNTLFDSTRRLLFLDFSTPNLEFIEEFYISELYDERYGSFRHDNHQNKTSNRRFRWIEEPYSEMFYYHEQFSDGVSLFKAPIQSFWRIITRVENGTMVKKLSNNELLNGVVGEAIYTVQNNTDTVPIHTSLTPMNSASGIVCEVESISRKLLNHQRVLAIRNTDYCRIRDGPDFDSDRCTKEQTNYMSLKRVKAGDVEEEVNVIKWLLIACIFMFTLVVLMCIYVFWLRNSFVVEEERSHEYDTEASLFVAKQRSFPSAYPALMDVSVDQ